MSCTYQLNCLNYSESRTFPNENKATNCFCTKATHRRHIQYSCFYASLRLKENKCYHHYHHHHQNRVVCLATGLKTHPNKFYIGCDLVFHLPVSSFNSFPQINQQLLTSFSSSSNPFQLSFNNVSQRVFPTQYVTNPASLPSFYFKQDALFLIKCL